MENLIEKLNKDYQQAWEWKKRRISEWNENYMLYRDRVIVDRLTQRQAVNIPLMKETLRTWLAQIDDAPDIVFECLEKETREQGIKKGEKGEITVKEKEMFLNEYWQHNSFENKLVLKDIVDKKQVGLYGRSFKKLNAVEAAPYVEILDPQDVLVDRYVDPADLDTAQFVIHIHIYRTLSELKNNPNYNKEAIKRLENFFATSEGLIKAQENLEAASLKARKMELMGVPDVEMPDLGEIYVELNEHYKKIWNGKEKRWEIFLIVKCNDEILMQKPLEEIFGKTKDNFWQNHYPFSTWADDLERTDFWSDGIADIVRVPNKVLNVWFSQLVENRTLRSFGMYFYDATRSEFVPQTFQPRPWGWYPLPGRPADYIQKVEIPDLSESIDEMAFLINLIEKATAVTAIQKGVSERKQITLGEVQILAVKAQERIITTAKFYREAWRDFAFRWLKLVEGQGDKLKAVKLFKKSINGTIFPKEIKPSDWRSETGYEVKVFSSVEQEADKMEAIQRLNAVIGQMPGNEPLQKIYKRKLLELVNLTPEEIKEVMDFEEKRANVLPAMAPMASATLPASKIPAETSIMSKVLTP